MTTFAGEPYGSVVEANELPRLVKVGPNHFAAVFTLMKLLPARHMIEQAEHEGALRPGATVLETSSGTFALGLALVCRLRGHPLVVVGDPAIDRSLKDRLEMLGARVEIVDTFDGPGGIQGARLSRLKELHAQIPDSFVPGQYDSTANPAAYGLVARQLERVLGRVDRLVGAVGSGGSTGGLACALRAAGHPTRLVGVDTPGSVIFGTREAPRMLRGLGSSIHPGNVNHTAYDEVHWVGAGAAFSATRRLFADRGMFVGPTSGAAYLASSVAPEHDRVTVTLFPDDGFRYLDTVYSEQWLRSAGLWATVPPDRPRDVTHPAEVGRTDAEWCRIAWARRSLRDVLDHGVGT